MRKEEVSDDLISEVIGINHIYNPGKRDYYIDLLFRLCESMEKGSFIELLIDNLRDVVGNSESAIRNEWEDHKEKIQIERDNKKDKILKDHNIPVWRIKSTDAIEQNDVELKLKTQINEFKRNLYQFLNENKWKK